MLKRSRRDLQHKTSERERWFQVLLDAAPDAMVAVDQDGKIVFVNTQTEKLFGYQREEILGLDVEVLIPERLREHHRPHRKGFFAQPHVRPMGAGLELFGVRKGGGEFPVEVSLSPVETREGLLVTSAIRDVSERRLAEGSRLRLAAIVESSEDAIISKTLDGVIVSWNRGAQQIFGYTEAEAVGRPITILFPSELRDEENMILERLRAGEHIEHYETVRVTKAGSRIDVSLSLSPIKDSSGRIVGFCKIARDITERKLAEARLRESEERLRLAQQETLSGMTRALIEAQEQERARIGRELHDDINQRLAMLAVELEQPLDPSEFQNRVQAFRKELRQISEDVQALSHELHSSKIEYLGVVAGMKSWCKELAERQKMDIDFKSDARSVLPLDIGRPLFRVLQEALHNSFKHSGVKRIEVRLREDSGEIHLIVSDSGVGFDLAEAKKGRGLGLTSMQERVRLLNGTITIESKLRGGTTIHVRVPFNSEDASRKAAS